MTATPVQADLFAPPTVGLHAPAANAELHCAGLAPEARRAQGITLTPHWLIELMLDHAAASGSFDTIVDAGAGTGRFTFAAAARFPKASVLAVEQNPELAAMLREAIQRADLQGRVFVIEGDFRTTHLELAGRILFIGNPPYVRHHDIGAQWKAWYRDGMAQRGIAASQLAGLHAHFMLRTAALARPGDSWCLVTAAEWLDNGYGSALRQLTTQPHGLGLQALWLAPPGEPVFVDALVSAAVFAGTVGVDAPGVSFGRVAGRRMTPLRQLDSAAVRASVRWSELCQFDERPPSSGVEVGELFKVTRGQVTGLNAAWILPPDAPSPWQALGVAAVTRAREIIDGTVSASDAASRVRRVIDLPSDLDQLAPHLRAAADQLVARARALGAHNSYVARQRAAWFSVGMRAPPAAFVSYMGRRPPVFRANPQGLSYLNIAHGLYPRVPVTPSELSRLLDHLNANTALFSGRVYGGGLAKFEPSDIARLRLPQAVWEPRP